MCLGAGPFQTPAIRKAVASGYYVITVDYLPENVGHRFSHRFVNCSTIDRDGVLSAAMRLGVDGIATFASDIATPTLAYVTTELGLPGPNIAATETMTDKSRFRMFQERHGFRFPRFVVGESYHDVAPDLRKFPEPLVFKPIDSSGSRGISVVSGSKASAHKNAFEHARRHSRAGRVCVEQYVHGLETGGDAFLVDGKIAFVAITNKHTDRCVVTGHNLPSNFPMSDQKVVAAVLEEHCEKLEYSNGPLNFDAIVTAEEVIVLEMSPRTGGNGIPAIIARSTGVDIEMATLRAAMEEPIQFPRQAEVFRGSGSLVFGSVQGGVLAGIADEAQLSEEIPEVFEMYLAVQPGDRVLPFEHNGNLVGCVLFDCGSPKAYEEISQRILDALHMCIEAPEVNYEET